MDAGNILRDAKSGKQGGKRGFVFAAELSSKVQALLEEIRSKASEDCKVLTNVALAEAAITELHRAYVGEPAEGYNPEG